MVTGVTGLQTGRGWKISARVQDIAACVPVLGSAVSAQVGFCVSNILFTTFNGMSRQRQNQEKVVVVMLILNFYCNHFFDSAVYFISGTSCSNILLSQMYFHSPNLAKSFYDG